MARFEELTVDDSPMRLCFEVPAGDGPHPGIIVMCHGLGLDAFTTSVVDRLAQEGYVAAAPHVFHRQTGKEDRAEKIAKMVDGEVVSDMAASIAYLESSTNLDPARLAILGHCMGGRMAFLGACAERRFSAAVIHYSGNVMMSWGDEDPPVFDRLKNITCPVIGYFGNDDDNPSPDDVDAIDAELGRCGIDHEFYRYDGAGHAFQNWNSEIVYREVASDDAWDRTLAFLAKHLGIRAAGC